MNSKHWRAAILTLGIFPFLMACSKPDQQVNVETEVNNAMDSLVTAQWLKENLDDPDLVVLDATVLVESDGAGNFKTVNGRAHYESGHIPKAVFADLKGELSDSESPIGYAVPSPEQFAAAMGALGVGDNTRVVIYDDNTSSWAARVWWMLRWVGFDNSALLDGGLEAWKTQGYELSTEPENRVPRELTVNLRPELIVDRQEVLAAIEDDSVILQDALMESQYRGDISMYARPGHIPTATNVPMMSILDDSGKYKSPEELEGLFSGARDVRTINYCGGGISASNNAFIMHRLGYKDVAVYTASLQEWSADPSNPLVTGPLPNGTEK